MKKLLLLAVLAAFAMAARADFDRLVFRTVAGEEMYVGLTDLSITFADGNMHATSAEASVTAPVASLASMEFGNGAVDGIKDAAAETGVTVYTADGICRGSYTSAEAARQALPAGMYIIKSDHGPAAKMLINK